MRLDEGCVLVLPAQRIRGAVAHFRRGAAPSPGKRGPAGMSPEPGAVPARPARRAPRARHLLPSGPRAVEGLPASSSGLHLIREPPPHLDPGTLPPAARPVSRAVSFQHHVLERPWSSVPPPLNRRPAAGLPRPSGIRMCLPTFIPEARKPPRSFPGQVASAGHHVLVAHVPHRFVLPQREEGPLLLHT